MNKGTLSAVFCIIRATEDTIRFECTGQNDVFWANVLLQAAMELVGDEFVNAELESMIGEKRELKAQIDDLLKSIGGYTDAK